MARRRRKQKKPFSFSFPLTQRTLSIFFVLLGGIYFFALSLAEGSPTLMFLKDNAAVAFGKF